MSPTMRRNFFFPFDPACCFCVPMGPLAGRCRRTRQEAFVKLWRRRQRQIDKGSAGSRTTGRVPRKRVDEPGCESTIVLYFTSGALRSRWITFGAIAGALAREARPFPVPNKPSNRNSNSYGRISTALAVPVRSLAARTTRGAVIEIWHSCILPDRDRA